MLVLTSHKDTEVIITTPEGRAIRVMVTDIDRNRVRLGFTADKEVLIYRSELLPRKAAERTEAP